MLAFIDESLLKFSWSIHCYHDKVVADWILPGPVEEWEFKLVKVWSFFQTVMYVLHHLSILLFC
jgi:hypothetical protein